MKKLLLLLLVSCAKDSSCPPDMSKVECEIQTNEALIKSNKERIEENERNIRLLQRVHDLRRAVDCINDVLNDKKANDRDQLLTIDACLTDRGWRQ